MLTALSISSQPHSNRDLRIDTIKGILIILVVLGHAIERLYGEQPIKAIYTAIYSFHMPLFILVSGYVFRPSMNVQHFFKGILRLAETLLLFQGLRCLILFSHGELTVEDLITPYNTYWYLLALIFWRSLAFLLLGCFKIKWLLLLPLSFIVALAIGYIPISLEFTFQRTFAFFPFFLLGMYLRDNPCSKKRLLKFGGVYY